MSNFDRDIENALENNDYARIMEKASQKFRPILSRDEIESCKKTALWKALQKYDESHKVKFTSFLFRGVFLECKTYAGFVVRGRKHKDKYLGQYHPNLSDMNHSAASIDWIDELRNIEDGNILIDFFFNKMSTVDIANKTGYTNREIINKKKNALENLRQKLV